MGSIQKYALLNNSGLTLAQTLRNTEKDTGEKIREKPW